jgi:hypothetical protein
MRKGKKNRNKGIEKKVARVIGSSHWSKLVK